MTDIVNVWPQLGTNVTLESGYVITAAGAAALFTDEIAGLVRACRLLTEDPTLLNPNPSPIPPTDQGGTYSFATPAVAAATVTTADGAIATLHDTTSANVGQLVWSVGDTTPADNALVYGSGSGRWKRLRTSKEINVRWFGAKGDNVTDDTAAIQAAIDAATAQCSTIYFPCGAYKITQNLLIGAPGGTWGLTFQGEAAGTNDNQWSRIVWHGPPGNEARRKAGMLQIQGFDHLFRNLMFDAVGSTFAEGNAKGCAVSIGGDNYDGSHRGGASHIVFERCRFQGFEIGAAFGLDGGITGNLEQCAFIDCNFTCIDTGVWIRHGQPYNTFFVRCLWARTPPPWVTLPVQGSNAASYGVGVRIWDDANNASASVWFDAPNFSYLAYGVVCESGLNLNLRDIDSEGVKRLVDIGGGLGQNCQYLIESGRTDNGANDEQRSGLTYDGTTYRAKTPAIATDDYRYLRFASGNVHIDSVMFLPLSGEASTRFKIELNGTCNLQCENSFFPHVNPFVFTGSTAFDGINAWYGKTFVLANNACCAVGENPQCLTSNRTSLPTWQGCRNAGGSVTFSDTTQEVQVNFTNLEPEQKPFTDPESVLYSVDVSINYVSTSAAVSTPYVTEKRNSHFKVRLPSAPGAGQSLKVAYSLRRD